MPTDIKKGPKPSTKTDTEPSAVTRKSIGATAAACAIAVAARLFFTIFLYDSVTAFTGAEPFSVATVDSSASHWRERLYWERAAEEAYLNNTFDASSAFLPFYLDQIPYWPVKMFMLFEDAMRCLSLQTSPSSSLAVPQEDGASTIFGSVLSSAAKVSVIDYVMIAMDGILVTMLLKRVSVKKISALAQGTKTANSPTSLFIHSLNPLAIFCCCTLSLRVVEHVVVLALIWLLLLDDPIRYENGIPVYTRGSATRARRRLITFSFSCLALCLLVAITPGMVVLLVPIGFHFICDDGRTSYRRYAVCSFVIFIISGVVAYVASIGLAELPTTTPPDAGHQSYLWQILLPEIAELAQATFVIGPVAACAVIGLQLCDPLIRLNGYRSTSAITEEISSSPPAIAPAAETIESKETRKSDKNDVLDDAQPSLSRMPPSLVAPVPAALATEPTATSKDSSSDTSPTLLSSASSGFLNVSNAQFGRKTSEEEGFEVVSKKSTSKKTNQNSRKQSNKTQQSKTNTSGDAVPESHNQDVSLAEHDNRSELPPTSTPSGRHELTSPVLTPLRALIVGCILFSVIVRRYYSLVDTLFAVVVVPAVVTPHILRAMLAEGYFILPLLLMSLAIPLQHATYTSWVVKQLANANWLYFANLIHHAGLCLYCGQFILTSLRPSQAANAKPIK